MSGNKDVPETSPAYLKDFAVLRRTLFSGDCVEELTNKAKKVFVLEDFLVNVEELKAFESSVARVKKVVYLGSDPLTTELSEIAYHAQVSDRLEYAPKGENYEFQESEYVRNDLAVFLVHPDLVERYKKELRLKFEVISIDEEREKIKKEGEEGDDEKVVTDSEV